MRHEVVEGLLDGNLTRWGGAIRRIRHSAGQPGAGQIVAQNHWELSGKLELARACSWRKDQAGARAGGLALAKPNRSREEGRSTLGKDAATVLPHGR
ncbi:MAG: hypothetical protein RMJ98_02475, partial [Myxococcales bacterium]|nr:hypothetical protein [Myxococcales bacterium]